MNTPRTLALTTLALITPSLSPAQCFSAATGTTVNPTDDSLHTVALGFPFVWPDGSTTTDVTFDENARVFQTGAFGSDFTPSVSEFLGGGPQIAPFWEDLDVTGVSSSSPPGDVTFVTDGAFEASIRWVDTSFFGFSDKFSFELTLRGDGSMRFSYDNRLPVNAIGLVGVSPGGGAADPGPVDLASIAGGGVLAAPTGVFYETFAIDGDLAGLGFEIQPNGPDPSTAGYTIVGLDCITAFALGTGASCRTGNSTPPYGIDFAPDGLGGYAITQSTAVFDNTNLGASMGHGDDTVLTASLGFGFVMPGGTFVNTIDVDSNGRILVGNSGATSDFAPTVAALLTAATPQFAVLHADFAANFGGDILFFSDGVNRANVTWLAVPNFGTSNAITFQAQLDATSGILSVVFEDTSSWDRTGDFTDGSTLVGCSPGGGVADPGETDLSTFAAVSNGNPTIYEFFDGTLDEVFDLAQLDDSTDLVSLTPPQLGTSWDLAVDEIPPTALSTFLLLGNAFPMPVPLNLAFPGLNCSLDNDIALGAHRLPITGSTASFSIDLVSADTALAGLEIHVQALVVDPSVPWATPPSLPLSTTNGILGRIGF